MEGQINVFFAIMYNSSNSRHTSLNQKPVPVILAVDVQVSGYSTPVTPVSLGNVCKMAA